MSETHYWVYDESFDSAEKAHELAMVVIRTRDQTIAAKDTTIAQQAVTIRTLRAALDATQKELWDTVNHPEPVLLGVLCTYCRRMTKELGFPDKEHFRDCAIGPVLTALAATEGQA